MRNHNTKFEVHICCTLDLKLEQSEVFVSQSHDRQFPENTLEQVDKKIPCMYFG
jgi:hypothetical protein